MKFADKIFRRQPMLDHKKGPHVDGDFKRCLGLTEVIGFGLSCTVGSGIFVTVGILARGYSGPALCVSMMLAILGSLLSALCYAEFASKIPVAGQAYTYCYVCMGEVWGFLSGWISTIPYTVSSAAVARGWANYMGSFFLSVTGKRLPGILIATPTTLKFFSISLLAPSLCLLCTFVCLKGVQDSACFTLVMTILNVSLLSLFSIYGSFEYADASNLSPFLPEEGVVGVMKGAGLAFFCCVGWDSVCTLSEEVKNPQRDIPRGLLGTLAVVAVLYGALSLTLCAMVPASSIDPQAPLSAAFAVHHDSTAATVMSLAAITVCTPSVLGGIVAQPRIWYSMAKDGLLWPRLAEVNEGGIPVAGTLLCGFSASFLALVLDFESLASVTSVATLLMLLLVCAGVVACRYEENHESASTSPVPINFELFYFALSSLLFHFSWLDADVSGPIMRGGLKTWIFLGLNVYSLSRVLRVWQSSNTHNPLAVPFMNEDSTSTTSDVSPPPRNCFRCPLMPYIPLLAVWVNAYLTMSLGADSLLGCLLWVAVGMVVYVSYSMHNSKLN